jgi:tRNA (mo5U34)-methyltransferase
MVAPHSSAERTEQQVLSLGSWFHNLHLPDGVQTAPQHTLGDFPDWKWQQFADHLPGDMNGWTALDVGCNAGFYSFELAKRGASVFAIDHDEHYLKQARWAAERLGLAGRVRFKRMQVYDLARLSRRFDLVFFMGVFYHLRYPLLALDLVAEKVQRLMVFQTLTMPGAEEGQTPVDLDMEAREQMLSPGWPKMAFAPLGA